MRRLLPSALSLFALSGCQCIDPETFGAIPDAGTVVEPPPPEPPVFPLKSGDVLVYPGVGGRNGTDACAGTPGDCERTMKATYTIQELRYDEDQGRWIVSSDYLYEMQQANVDEGVIAPLFLHGVADFSLAGQQADDGTADFNTDGAPIETITANDFPFFHYEPTYANQDGSAFDDAANEFRERITQLDPDAKLDLAPAKGAFDAYFKDSRADPPQLHKVFVELHPFGFMCGWDERLIPWEDSMGRQNSDFSGRPAGLVSVMPSPIRLIRDDEMYLCFCTQGNKVCKQNDDQSLCLDPADPDAPPSACP